MCAAQTEFRELDTADRLRENDVNPYYIGELKRRVSVARVSGKLYAFDDLYEGCPLSSGLLTGTTLMSQYDGSLFDITSGAVLSGPARRALGIYPARERAGKIEVCI
jgi:3-phenylpropionate/trans-cinnamate dioxygenase ferredoxin component